MKNRFFTNGSLSQFPGIIYQPNLATFLGKFILILTLLTSVCTFAIAQTESDYEVEDVSDEYKKVCWPIKNTSKTQATTDKMTTDTAGFPTVKSGGLASYRQMYTAVEVPNIFPAPDTAEIFDLLGNPLIINGDTLRFFPSTLAASLAQANMTPPLTPGYHWVGYISSPFRPDNVAVYYYNIFHRWYGGMPCNYESYGGRQWNSDNSGLAHPSDTFFSHIPCRPSFSSPFRVMDRTMASSR